MQRGDSTERDRADASVDARTDKPVANAGNASNVNMRQGGFVARHRKAYWLRVAACHAPLLR